MNKMELIVLNKKLITMQSRVNRRKPYNYSILIPLRGNSSLHKTVQSQLKVKSSLTGNSSIKIQFRALLVLNENIQQQ